MRKLLLAAFLMLLLTNCATPLKENKSVECHFPYVPISGFAQSFVGASAIANANLTILENHQQYTTNNNGEFSFCALPHQKITLILEKKSLFPWDNYKTTQTGTFIVPSHGMTTQYNQITFQVPRQIIFDLLKTILSSEHHLKLDPNKCTVATTITAFHKTLFDDPQGEPNAVIVLKQKNKIIKTTSVIYFGILHGKTNPFDTSYPFSSKDGGVIIYNLEPSQQLYMITAKKKGFRFSTEYFLCRPGAFINLSPPNGPRVL